MIDKLRFCTDNTDNPKLLRLLSEIAELPEKDQEITLQAALTLQVAGLLGDLRSKE